MSHNKGPVREIPFFLLVPDPDNVRVHPKAQSEQLRAAITKHGQPMPLIVAHEKCFKNDDWGEKYIIIGGNETAKQLQALGYKEANCQEVEGTADDLRQVPLPINWRGLSLTRKRAEQYAA